MRTAAKESSMTTILLDERSQRAIEELRVALRATSKAEVMRRALVLLQHAIRTTQKGGKVILREPSSGTEPAVEREVLLA